MVDKGKNREREKKKRKRERKRVRERDMCVYMHMRAMSVTKVEQEARENKFYIKWEEWSKSGSTQMPASVTFIPCSGLET